VDSLVLELQKESWDSSVSISYLLRKALVVAAKLEIAEFKTWVEDELKGYADKNEVPEYRTVSGEVKTWNPYHGWVPVIFDDATLAERLSNRPIGQPIAELEDLIDRGKYGFQVPFPKDMELNLMQGTGYPSPPSLHIDGARLHGIIEAIRKIVLDWSLKLEKDGILGKGMTFTTKEKQIASSITYNINIGTVSNSQIQQGTQDSVQQMETGKIDLKEVTKLLQSIKDSIDSLGIDSPEKEELLADLETIQSQASSPKPKATIIRKCWKSIRTILEGAAANTLASGFLQQIGLLLG